MCGDTGQSDAATPEEETVSGREQPVWALGLMSGTSMDGVDAALIKTDGERVVEFGETHFQPYSAADRDAVRAVLGARVRAADVIAVEDRLTQLNGQAADRLIEQCRLSRASVRVVGYHGQTITHDPVNRFTWQIGDGPALARGLGIDVVYDFRTADVAEGGEGAPLAPAYHKAVLGDREKPLAVLNLGGVGNITWIGADGDPLAFDTGPANALLDDWMLARCGVPFDEDGATAARGTVNQAVLARLLDHPYFDQPAPKSLDRNAFSLSPLEGLSVEDGAATLVAFTVAAIARADVPARPLTYWVTGGGRSNRTIMRALGACLGAPARPVEDAGLDGDNLEAQAFAFLAVRHLRGLPTSFPTTTNAPRAICGGRVARCG